MTTFLLTGESAADKIEQRNRKFNRNLLLGFALFGAILGVHGAAHAVDATSAIDGLKTDSAKVVSIYDSVTPAAVGSTVFGIGAILVKRIAFS